jgi:NAD-dependent SIR2 family protein deacetylase
MQYQEFVASDAARTRYWARSSVGWQRIAAARPNAGHVALARLEAMGAVSGIITQNVDGLHQAAGSRRIVELHGALRTVICLGCSWRSDRGEFQRRLEAENFPRTGTAAAAHLTGTANQAPDGDAELPPEVLEGFRVPECDACGGIVKPDVVFFGESVPRDRVDQAWQLFAEAEVLLVVGSSLTVYSGRRFIYRAQTDGVPIGIVNLGPTRGDDLAAVKVDGKLGELMPLLLDGLHGSVVRSQLAGSA